MTEVTGSGFSSARPGGADGSPSTASEPLVALDRVTKRFGPVRVLDGVSVAFRGGEVHALVGENGAGKSTLLKIMCGVVRPDPPTEMTLAGRPVELARFSPRAAQAAGISVVRQELAVVEPMTVAENIFLGREPRKGPILDRRRLYGRAAALLERVGGNFPADAPVERLSIAQLQLVEIAKALSVDARVLAMDEPSAVLAGEELERMFRVIHQLAADGVAIVYVSHRLDEVFAHCDRYTVLKDGRVVSTGAVASLDRHELVRMMVGREVTDSFPDRSARRGDPQLRVSDLSVAGKLRHVSFEARSGEILGVAGLMGCGRTTLAKAVFGAVPVSAGSVEVNGARGPFTSPAQALKAGLAYLPEDRRREGLAVTKSVRWNATLLALRRLVTGPFRLIDRRSERAVVERSVSDLSIHTSAVGKDLIARLSGGNQQKVVLAKWLLANPRVLILDEPTRGIDVGTKEEIYRTLRGLADDGLAVVVISSELIELLGLADRIIVLGDGRLAGELDGATATEEAIMRLATATEEPKAVRGSERQDDGDRHGGPR